MDTPTNEPRAALENGTTVWGLVIPLDFRKVVLDMAVKENRMPEDVFIGLAIKGAECSRLHGGKDGR